MRSSNRRTPLLLTTLIFILVLTGCSALTSEKPEKNRAGLPYYLPSSLVKVTVEGKFEGKDPNKKFIYSMELETVFIPDAKKRYTLTYQWNPFASDRYCVARSTNGLLDYVQFAADDKTDEIIVKIAELAAKVFKAGPVPTPSASLIAGAPKPKPPKPFIVEKIVDPEVEKELAALSNEITAASSTGEKFAVKFPKIAKVDASKPETELNQCRKDSICFRTLITTTAELRKNSSSIIAGTVEVVDKRYVGKVKVTRALLVEKITKIDFSKGILTSISVKKPSEMLALVSLPLRVLDAIFAVPANFLKGATSGNIDTQKQILQQERDIAKLRADIAANNKKIRDAQQKPSKASEAAKSFELECKPISAG